MTHVMTDQDLQQAIQDANEAVYSLTRPPQPKGPFPKHEVSRREVILLRQVTVENKAEETWSSLIRPFIVQ